MNSKLKWNNHLETRIAKAQKVYEMVKRNSASNVSTHSMLLVNKFMIILSPLYGSECWIPNKSELIKLKLFVFRVTKGLYQETKTNKDYQPREFYSYHILSSSKN